MRVLILCIALFSFGCDKIQDIFVEEDILKRPPSKRCSDCHLKIYNQWEKSRHAQAWKSPDYIKATKNHSKLKCLSCHAPLEIKPFEKPILRDKLREEGINCFSCHYKEKTNSMHGPYKVFSPPHYSTYDPDYISSRVCSSCHHKTFEEWRKTASKENCQNCHMPGRKDRLIQKFPFTYFHSKKVLHSHSFPTQIAVEKDLDIKAIQKDGSIILKIKNTGIPHNLPTADNGKPKLYIKITGFIKGERVYEDSYIINPKFALEYKKEKEFIFFPEENLEKIKLEIFRKLSWKKKKEKIIEKDFYF